MAKEQLTLFETEIKKKCTKCGEIKGLDEYGKAKLGKYGKKAECKGCEKKYYQANKEKIISRAKVSYEENKEYRAEYLKEYCIKNRESLKKKKHLYYLENADYIRKKSRQYHNVNRDYVRIKSKIYRDTHKEEIRKQKRLYLADNPKQILRRRVSDKIRKSLIDGKNGRSWEKMVDYNLGDLVRHLKRKNLKVWNEFKDNPPAYHLDHIIPVDVFNFDRPDQIDFKKCWGMKNLQLLPALDNILKKNHIDEPFQPAFNMSFSE